MTRQLHALASAESKKALATQPMVIIRIQWENSGTKYYADKTVTFNGNVCESTLLDFSPIDATREDQAYGGFSSASVTMDDTSGTLKSKYNTELFEKTVCTVYHWWPTLAAATAVTVLKGKIWGEVRWSEGERTLEFTIESQTKGNVIGYASKPADITNLYEEAEDAVWPMVFGTAFRVPALRILKVPTGKTTTKIEGLLPLSVEIDDGYDFPQLGTDQHGNAENDEIYLDIDGTKFRGYFEGRTFTFCDNDTSEDDGVNVAFDEDVLFLARPGGDDDEYDASVAWITAPTDLTGKYCYIKDTRNNATYVNYCVKQESTKCWFERAWFPVRGRKQWGHAVDPDLVGDAKAAALLIDSNYMLLESKGQPDEEWSSQFYFYGIEIAIKKNVPVTVQAIATWWEAEKYLEPDTWEIGVGTPVIQLEAGYTTTYIANLESSDEILEVLGHRTTSNSNWDPKEKVLVPIPSDYYTVQTDKDYGNGYESTGLEFTKPLEARRDEGWDSEIYVSLRSDIGPNVCEVVEHLIETYSTLEVNSGDFDSVTGITYIRCTPYPVGFAMFDQDDVFDVCKDIAWQARCALYVNGNGDISMKYLSYGPTNLIQVVDEDVTKFKTMELGFTVIDDCITYSVWQWRKTYAQRTARDKKRRHSKREVATPDELKDLRNFIYENNTDNIGTFKETYEIYIYNIESLVKKTAVFWGYRLSNIWRTIRVDTFLKQIRTELFDDVNFSYQAMGEHRLPGLVTSVSHDTAAPIITLEAELASQGGEYCANGYPIKDEDYYLGDPTYVTYNAALNAWIKDRPAYNDTAPSFPTGIGQKDYTIDITERQHRCNKQDIRKLFLLAPKTQVTVTRSSRKGARVRG